jgi:hypothetical protein
MLDAKTRQSLVRLAHANPDLRQHLLPLITSRVAMEFSSQKALDKYLEAHPKADKSNHKVKDSRAEGGGKPRSNATYSKKHKIHLRGISDAALDEFYESPAGKAIREYNLEVIAGEDGVVDAKALERAVKVRDQYLAVEKAKAKPKSERTKAEDDALDVCQATPACKGNMGIARSSMPQFLQISPKEAIASVPDKRYKELLEREKSGKGLPENVSGDEREAYYNRKNAEAAVAAGADPNSELSVFDDWVQKLKKSGVKVTKPKGGMRVGDLKATQSEISADAVLRNADKYLRGQELTGGVIYVSSDGHILDGHHRWAGLLTADPNTKIPVIKLGLPMAELLEKSFEHPGVFRQDFRFDIVPEDDPIDLARKPESTWQQKGGKWYGKNSDGKAGGPFASQESAKNYASGKSNKSARWNSYSIRGASLQENAPMSDTVLRTRLIRLAHSRPDLRPHILPLVADKAACWGGEAPVTARFEEGVSADPTENMTQEDAAEWERQNELHRDNFTKGASDFGRGRIYVTDRAIRESFGNGVEDVLLVVDRGAKKPFVAALQVLKTHRAELERMDSIYKIQKFVDGKVLALTGKTPQWHSYSMPD